MPDDKSGHMSTAERRILEAKEKRTRAERLALANDLPLKTVMLILREERNRIYVEATQTNE